MICMRGVRYENLSIRLERLDGEHASDARALVSSVAVERSTRRTVFVVSEKPHRAVHVESALYVLGEVISSVDYHAKLGGGKPYPSTNRSVDTSTANLASVCVTASCHIEADMPNLRRN